ncbi:MAG: family acetyltransferase [Ferruginibacter sp.]|nr:family acetyltransferase [Ferruginibacter sp.]
MANIEIVPFSEENAMHFTRLNTGWLEKYFFVEPIDHQMLNDPKHFFIDQGGYIFFAKINGEVAGTFALLKESKGVYELSKMAVYEKYQGIKIGNVMIEFCIEKAAALKLTKLILYSNTKLLPAIHLYKKYGFIEVPITDSIYKRSNIKMELANGERPVRDIAFTIDHSPLTL